MKNLTWIAVLLIVSSAAFAHNDDKRNTNAKVTVANTKNEVYNLVYKGANPDKVKIEIYNEANDLIFSEKIRAGEPFARPYNFQELPAGEYTIKVTDAHGTVNRKVYHNIAVKVNDEAVQWVDVKPFNGKYKLTIISGFNNATVRVLANGERVYEDIKSIKNGYCELYRLKGPDKAVDYKMQVVINGEVSTFDL